MRNLIRQFRHHRLFSIVVVVLLGLGIGADTLVFSLVNQLILKPLPVRDPENLFLVQTHSEREVRPRLGFPYKAYEVFRQSRLISAAVAEEEWSPASLTPVSTGGAARLVVTQMVSQNYFAELGIRPAEGSLAVQPGAAILSHPFWRSEFAGNPHAIGRTIRLRGESLALVGVLPAEFHSADVDRAPDVRIAVSETGRKEGSFRILVRLPRGVTPERAAAELAAPLHDAMPPDTEEFRLQLVAAGRGISQLRDQFSRALWLLLGGVSLLLLAVCANVAGLLLARSAGRMHELAIRSALGAGRGRLVCQLLSENLVLAVLGAALGAAFAWLAAPQIVGLLPAPRDYGQFPSAQLLQITPDGRVLLFLVLVTGFCVLVSGLLPAWRISLGRELKAGRGFSRATAGLVPVALQAAFSVVLLVGAVLMLRTFHNLDHLNPGFDRDHVVSFSFDPQDAGYSPERSGEFYVSLRERVKELPGVRSANYALLGLMRSVGMKTTLAPQGVTLPKSTFLNTSLNIVEPGYFDTLGIPLLAGRNLTDADAGKKPLPILVNRAFADFFFRGRNPIGQTLVQGTDGKHPPTHVIVGLTATAKYRSMRESDPPTLYSALDLHKQKGWICLLYVRTAGPPAEMIGTVRKIAAGLDAGVPLIEAVTLRQEVAASLWQERLLALLSGFFGIVSLLLAGIGLYGSLAHSVAQRRRELGIRLAIGARFPHVVRTVCTPLATAVLCGIAAGFAGSWFLLRAASRLLFGVQAGDPISAVLAILVIGFALLASAALPVLRAVRTDPASALREE